MTESPSTDSSTPAYFEFGVAQAAARRRWTRAETARHLVHLEDAKDAGRSERDFEERSGVPRSTFRHWVDRRDGMDLAPAVVQFFESPDGLVFLHRLIVAALFVMTLRSPDGIRLVCDFLDLSGLGDLVAPSYGSVRAMANRMQAEVLDFDKEQRAKLADRMASKKITVCQDETFHPEICLVAMEPVSNFILLEAYAERRDADTWTTAMKGALAGLPVEVVQATSDEAKALLAHAKDAFEAHHSPDLFHVQHEVSRAVSAPLARRVEHAKHNFEESILLTEQLKAEHTAYETEKHGSGRPPDFAGRIVTAQEAEDAARLGFEEASRDRDEVKEAVRGLSTAYHPYRLSDGAHQSAEEVHERIDTSFDIIQAIADKAELPDRCHAGIKKARRVSTSMIGTIRYVHAETEDRIAALGLPSDLYDEVVGRLLPGLYLERVAARAATAEQRASLTANAGELMALLRDPLQALPDDRRREVERIAQDCADVFQRSSSCVEGRNGHLSLYHHGLHRLRGNKLAALTAVHNYYITRDDGSTAAERFFGSPPDDLFEHLVRHMPQPARPARKRVAPKRAVPLPKDRAIAA